MAFFTIHPAAGLTERQRRRASRDGPVAVATLRSHRVMLEAAGFVDVAETDFTAEFVVVTRAWMEQWEVHYDELAEMLGEEVVDERQADRQAQLGAIEDGILRRSVFRARRP